MTGHPHLQLAGPFTPEQVVLVADIEATLQAARDAGRLSAEFATVRPFGAGEAIVTVEAHPSDSGASAHRLYDVRVDLARDGWRNRPSGMQVIVDGREPAPRVDPVPLTELHIAVDEDCPSCGWPERWYAPDRAVFGCARRRPPCAYESTERTS